MHKLHVVTFFAGSLFLHQNFHVVVQALLATTVKQKVAKAYEEVEAGQYRFRSEASQVDPDTERAREKTERVREAIASMQSQLPELHAPLQAVLAQAAAMLA